MDPIFVLGCVRSGTSVINNSLVHIGIPGNPEGHIFPLLYNLHETIDNYYHEMDRYLGYLWTFENLDNNLLKETITHQFINTIKNTFSSDQWVDKTPGPAMINAAPFLLNLFPKAKFIFCKRRGVDCVLSQIRRYGEGPCDEKYFEYFCKAWSSSMENWLNVRDNINHSYIEIDHADLVYNIDEVCSRLSTFLCVSKKKLLLMREYFLNSFPERTCTRFTETSLSDTNWIIDRQYEFIKLCGHMMHAYKYPLDIARKEHAVIFLNYSEDRTYIDTSLLTNCSLSFKQILHGAFLLHPQEGNIDSQIRFKNISFKGHNRFESHITIANADSCPVKFSVKIINPSNNKALELFEKSLLPQEKHQFNFNFKPLIGNFDIILSTSMLNASDPVHYAWANWFSPRFTISI